MSLLVALALLSASASVSATDEVLRSVKAKHKTI
jgi:hypothetical protein